MTTGNLINCAKLVTYYLTMIISFISMLILIMLYQNRDSSEIAFQQTQTQQAHLVHQLSETALVRTETQQAINSTIAFAQTITLAYLEGFNSASTEIRGTQTMESRMTVTMQELYASQTAPFPTLTNTPRLDINPLVTPLPPTATLSATPTSISIPTVTNMLTPVTNQLVTPLSSTDTPIVPTLTDLPTVTYTATHTLTPSAIPIIPTAIDNPTATNTPTAPSTFTPEPILAIDMTETALAAITQLAVQQTVTNISISTITTDTPQNSVGDANIYPYYDNEVEYPNTTTIELSLIFTSLYVTPTPSGAITRVPITPSVPLPTVDSDGSITLTPRSARNEFLVEEIPPRLIASLVCLETSFAGCESQETRSVEIGKDNRWEWILSPHEQANGQQNLRLELYEANEDGERIGNSIWQYPFSIDVIQPAESTFLTLLRENVDAIITGIFGIIIASIGAGIFFRQRNTTNRESVFRKNILSRLYQGIKSVFNKDGGK